MEQTSWKDLSPLVRRAIVALGVVEVVLLLAAQIDLARRSPQEVLGSKAGWRLATLINVVGPVAYFARGRARVSSP